MLVIALLVFGPAKLPEIGRQIGGLMREVRRMSDDVRRTFDVNLDEHRYDNHRYDSTPSYNYDEQQALAGSSEAADQSYHRLDQQFDDGSMDSHETAALPAYSEDHDLGNGGIDEVTTVARSNSGARVYDVARPWSLQDSDTEDFGAPADAASYNESEDDTTGSRGVPVMMAPPPGPPSRSDAPAV